ncbi:helix-turn-helix domain-containing protein [Mycobacterium kansasii]|uniref:helix-turn-helix domain-containing protein n=1 Tax=Mycobacterium kansasii TaxID=1768 RepID=UPI001158369A|nr:helix-turn-helix transcriptional regulator [Mycobacterium kansasii]
MSSEEWERSMTERIGGAIKALRGKKRSAQWLADRTEELGYPIGRATVSEIETGRRRSVTVAELLILARALNTSPVSLLFPDPSDEITNLVEVVPGNEVTGFQAAQWFSGERPVSDLEPRQAAQDQGEYVENAKRLRGWRKIQYWYDRLNEEIPGHVELTDEQRKTRAFYLSQIADLKSTFVEPGPDGDN